MTSFQLTRSVLFVPASRPDRFPKALACGADVVVVDLEDAVALSEKEKARELLRQYLESHSGAKLIVRVNAADTKEFAQDLELCRQQAGVAAIMLAKAQSVEALQVVAGTGKAVWPLVETALGVDQLPRMSGVKGVERFCLGGLDMGEDLGMKPDTAGAKIVLDRVRSDLILYSALAGCEAPIETVYPSIEDDVGVERIARQACEMGFAGMLCIHPRQLPSIHRGFSPAPDELDWARRVLAAAEGGDGVFTVDGKMVDAPVIHRARLILSQADEVDVA
ncbi:CoA ester lyase [Marinobacter sp. NFXS9]|uniref:HpcH/HpaI aldolase/citrate lyase family protein n=1 Tax=Marinobacter sp. NFXS9 TaxID=2818433 RepID=UPI0032DE9889